MRELHTGNLFTKTEVLDEPGHGGANHHYLITTRPLQGQREQCFIRFQNGAIKGVGANGVTHEILLAILIDRMRGFQSGKYACTENELALRKMKEALMWLQERTRGREARGVEGTHEI